jgi:hypothetical protein
VESHYTHYTHYNHCSFSVKPHYTHYCSRYSRLLLQQLKKLQ